MEEETSLSKVAMYVTRGCLVIPVQVELHDDTVARIQQDTLEMVTRTGVKGVVIDLSGVAVIDSFIGQAIADSARMASLVGARTVISGITPGVAASLVDLDFELRDVLTAVSLEQGFRMLAPVAAAEEQPEEQPEEAPEDEAAGEEQEAAEDAKNEEADMEEDGKDQE